MSELRKKLIKAMELKNLAPNTKRGYLSSITTLAKHYQTPPDKITHEMIEDFIIYLKNDRALSSSSLSTYVGRFKFFYNTVLGNEPPLDLSLKKRRRKLPVILSQEEIWRLMKHEHKPLISGTYPTWV